MIERFRDVQKKNGLSIGPEVMAMAIGGVVLAASCIKGKERFGTGLGLGLITGGVAAMALGPRLRGESRNGHANGNETTAKIGKKKTGMMQDVIR